MDIRNVCAVSRYWFTLLRGWMLQFEKWWQAICLSLDSSAAELVPYFITLQLYVFILYRLCFTISFVYVGCENVPACLMTRRPSWDRFTVNIKRMSSEIDLAQFVNKLVRVIEPRHAKVIQLCESYRVAALDNTITEKHRRSGKLIRRFWWW